MTKFIRVKDDGKVSNGLRLLNIGQVTAVYDNGATTKLGMSDGKTIVIKMSYSEFLTILKESGFISE